MHLRDQQAKDTLVFDNSTFYWTSVRSKTTPPIDLRCSKHLVFLPNLRFTCHYLLRVQYRQPISTQESMAPNQRFPLVVVMSLKEKNSSIEYNRLCCIHHFS